MSAPRAVGVAGLVAVDSDLVIDFLCGHGPGVGVVHALVAEHRLRVTAVTAFELSVGTGFHAGVDKIHRLLRSRTLPLDTEAAIRAGQIAGALRGAGNDIGLADCMQAGICIRWELPLATRNRRYFTRVPGLRLWDLPS